MPQTTSTVTTYAVSNHEKPSPLTLQREAAVVRLMYTASTPDFLHHGSTEHVICE